MPSVQVNSNNITTFAFSASFDLYNKNLLFSSAASVYPVSPSGLKISFKVEDKDGVVYKDFDFTAPDIDPSITDSYTLDMSSFGLQFLLGNTFKITGGIQDVTATIYYTPTALVTVCKPVGITESGYVPGSFQVIASCPDNTLTVKEITLFTYNNLKPASVSKSGILYYPVGTIAQVAFTGTPFTNNQIYTGENRINCTTAATYDMGNGIFVIVTYITAQAFKVTCSNRIMDLMCCLVDLERTAKIHCDDAIGLNAKQKMAEVQFYLVTGLGKEINGQDASYEADFIRKTLSCDCGATSLGQNEQTPINPLVTNIVLQGAGGTQVDAPVINGNTKTFSIRSSIYRVAKGDPSDLAWTITTDTSVANVVTYKITFNYSVMAGYILTAIQSDPSLLSQLNSFVTGVFPQLTGLNGKCVIDLTKADYAVSQAVDGTTIVTSVVINGTTYTAPSNLQGNDAASISTWLNSLTLGTFNVVVNAGVLTIMSIQNTNVISTISFTNPTVTRQWSSTTATVVQVFQAIIDYLCALTACQVSLCNTLSFLSFDYNGNLITTTVNDNNTQDDLNTLLSNVINNLANRINTLTGITCAKIAALFPYRPLSSFTGTARVYGMDPDGNCVAWSPQQMGLGVMQSAQAFQNVKDAFCAIDCTVPANCPDISAINMSIIGGNIGIYGVTFSPAANASQTLIVRYRINGTTSWTVATSNLGVFANGLVSGTSPYQISGLNSGTTYDVFITNSCGGAGFITQISTPTTTIYSGSFRLDNIIYNICGESPVTLYSINPFATGVTMYSDIGLTTPVTGFTFIANQAGNIFGINTSTGVVGSDTGNSCTSGTAGTYILGNDSGTICTNSSTTLYTSGVFGIGGTLYYDSGLTTPVTGFSFVVNTSNNHIYNLNSSNGVIGADTGLTCTINYRLTAALALSIDSVVGTGVPALGPTGTNGAKSGFQTGMSGTYAVTITGTTGATAKLVALVDGVQVDCVNIPSAATYGLNITATSAQDVIISINFGTC
jgi:hypothetical protein